MYLIERLEADRQYAEEALHKEKRRKRFLENKVDSIALWKQQEHAFVVQRGQWLRDLMSSVHRHVYIVKYCEAVLQSNE